MGLVFDWGGFGGEAVPCGGANGAHHGSLGHRPRCARHPPSQALKGRNNVCRSFGASVAGWACKLLGGGGMAENEQSGFHEGVMIPMKPILWDSLI